MTETIEVMMNADGSFDLPSIHVVPYVAPVTPSEPPVDQPPPPPPPKGYTVAFKAWVNANRVVAVQGASTGLPDGTKASVTWEGNSTTAFNPTGGQSASYQFKDGGSKTLAVKFVFPDGVGELSYTLNVDTAQPPTLVTGTIVPQPAGGTSPGTPPPVSPPPPPSMTLIGPSVIADGQSILYHYPMDVALAATIDTIEIPGTFGGSPETVSKIAWNFGDGTNGFGADGRHPYDKPGTYTITGSVNYKDGSIVPFGPLTVTV